MKLSLWTSLFMATTIITFVVETAHAAAAAAAPPSPLMGALQDVIQTLRGADDRLIPWDVTAETSIQQDALCPKALPDALEVLVSPLPPASSEGRNGALALQTLAATVAALCVTDKPANRAVIASFNTPLLYESVAHMVSAAVQLYGDESPDTATPDDFAVANAAAAAACHLIWIASYGNAVNHAGFVPAVPLLSQLIVTAHQREHVSSLTMTEQTAKKERVEPATAMWAAAALQNLAASYCDNSAATAAIEDQRDPRCHWEWKLDEATHLYTLAIEETAQLVIDATAVRQTLVDTPDIVDALLEWTCRGPVGGDLTHWNPFPGESAIAHQPWLLSKYQQQKQQDGHEWTDEDHEAFHFRHESSTNLVPWAAAGALRNLILHPAARAHVDEDVSCFCWLQRSPDWLEANKGEGVLNYLRPTQPCNFEDEEPHDADEDEDHHEDEEDQRIAKFYLCVDTTHFLDVHHNACDDMMAAPELCESSMDVSSGVAAMTACCACGGGVIDNTSRNGLQALGLMEDETEDEFEDEL